MDRLHTNEHNNNVAIEALLYDPLEILLLYRVLQFVSNQVTERERITKKSFKNFTCRSKNVENIS